MGVLSRGTMSDYERDHDDVDDGDHDDECGRCTGGDDDHGDDDDAVAGAE